MVINLVICDNSLTFAGNFFHCGIKTLAKGKTFIRIRQEFSKKKDYTHIKIYCLWQKNNQL